MKVTHKHKYRAIQVSTRKKRFVMLPLAAALLSTSVMSAESVKVKSLEEVIVTATKRALDLQDVPQSISAFSTEDIKKMGVKSMDDYVNALPSVTLTASQPGRNSLTMRGISSGSQEYYTDSQVAVYLDEQPMTTNSQQVSVRTIDMERVESLQGPQGTLFGSSSQTGTLRLITNKPSHEGFSGSVEAGYGTTKGGDDSYDVNGHLNIPLVDDVLSLRAVAYVSHDGGYVDNVYGQSLSGNVDNGYGQPRGGNHDNADVVDENQNEYGTIGGRISLLWTINENWSGLFSLVGENSELDGTWETDPYLGDYKTTRFLDENRDDDWLSSAFTLKGDLGFAELSATATHYERDIAYNWDNDVYTQSKDASLGAFYNTEYNRSYLFNDQSQERDTFELRLASLGESRFQWIAGLYYEDVYDEWFYGTYNENLTSTEAWATASYYAYLYSYYGSTVQEYPLPASDYGYLNIFERSVKQTAVFSEVTYDITDELRVLAGARWAEFEREESNLSYYPAGLIIGGGEGPNLSDGKDDDTIFKFALQYEIDDDRMVYALYSQGFRLGGVNTQRAIESGTVAASYGTDTLDNFELGIKSQWWDNRLQINAQLFYMQWSDYQQSYTGAQWWNRGTLNAGDAETTGIEMNISLQATDNLKVDFNVFVADAEFKDDIAFDLTDQPLLANGNANPDFSGYDITKGMDMPGSPDVKGWMSLYYDIPDVLGGDAWVYFDTSYQDRTWNGISDIVTNDKNGLSDTYTVSNLSLGLRLPSELTVTLRVENLFDEAAYTYVTTSSNGDADVFNDPRFHNERSLETPRTMWLTVRQDF